MILYYSDPDNKQHVSEPFIALHLLWSLEGQSIDCVTLFNGQNSEEQVETTLYFLCFESMRERYCMLTLSRPINILFLLS